MNDELRKRVVNVLTETVGPALHLDGSAMEVLDISAGVVQLRLGDALAACPCSIMTVIHGIEQELRRHIPEVEYLEVVP